MDTLKCESTPNLIGATGPAVAVAIRLSAAFHPVDRARTTPFCRRVRAVWTPAKRRGNWFLDAATPV